MVETNVRIVNYGTRLYMDVRRVTVVTHHTAPDLLENVCKILKKRRKLAAVRSNFAEEPEIIIASFCPISQITLKEEDWQVELIDKGSHQLRFSQSQDVWLLAQLMERSLLVEIERQTDFWTLDSPRIWYSPTPFQKESDISAFRRFHVSVIPIESEGLGVVTEVSTAFFTNLTVADYFQNGSSKRFEFLAQRQNGKKGTLLYDLGHRKIKCYFEEFLTDVTCATTGKIRIRGHTYDSLYDYYCQKNSNLPITKDDLVAKVSFPGLGRPQFVAANRLTLRVMNEALPKPLDQLDKIPPSERTRLVEEFWNQLDEKPFGRASLGVNKHLWCPNDDKIICLPPSSLEFGNGKILDAPIERNTDSYKEYYRNRLRFLNTHGCFYVPPTIERKIHFAIPDKGSEEMVERIAKDITEWISKWTKRNIIFESVPYTTIEDAFGKLRKKGSGVVVFVFEDDEPATYFNIAYELKLWRIKRITYSELKTRYNRLVKDEAQWTQQGSRPPKGVLRWQSFVEMSALGVLQQLDCVQWIPAIPLNYEAHLAIDVGADRRHFALSLLICREKQFKPAFWLDTVVHVKSDPKHETINEIILYNEIIALFKRAYRTDFIPLRSVLILRDGRKCGREIDAIQNSKQSLISLGLLDKDAAVHIVDFHKKSQKEIRMWEKNYNSRENLLEGTGIILDDKVVVLANTGIATLLQGTASPFMLVANGDDIDMTAVAEDIFVSAQLNYSNPLVAQRLPHPLKRTDEELKNRAAQEIRRIG